MSSSQLRGEAVRLVVLMNGHEYGQRTFSLGSALAATTATVQPPVSTGAPIHGIAETVTTSSTRELVSCLVVPLGANECGNQPEQRLAERFSI